MKTIVVAAIIERNGRRLYQQRDPEQTFPYVWCSPGGKVNPGETDEAALQRELREECDTDALIGDCVFTYEDEHRIVRFYRVTRWSGTPDRRVGIGIGWFTPEEASKLEMTPADAAEDSMSRNVWAKAHQNSETSITLESPKGLAERLNPMPDDPYREHRVIIASDRRTAIAAIRVRDEQIAGVLANAFSLRRWEDVEALINALHHLPVQPRSA